ncbi:Type I restriction modification DNA specificity domain-containing protein [Flavobacterium sp. CF108]|uniref:restriction endonuclease subunit S n=1 Tax=unclassified Flavobacterium TaxID=196869 RepID=UPI0008D42E99|nr:MULTISPECIES: restriction endonuclease subunit S [unclassified Flavobacterium]SEO80039.1 Type I restriction modification DNA specificity domain-containing protein [Flavobacterium sp. fv08]SHG75441.1 Type I restriction modification DNA specificity domain-containing protein [Flavobacterium sp. CF108]
MDLNNILWEEYVFEDVFKIYSTKSGIDKNKLILKKGNIPYVTRTEKNNAIDFFICEQDEQYEKDKKNVITIGLDTQTVFYQKHEFYTGQNIQILENDNLNFNNSQFLIPLIKKQMEKFSWGGNGATLTRLKRTRIILPSKNSKPDFLFMEQFIQQKEKEKLDKFLDYITKKINEVKDYKEVKLIEKKDWVEYKLSDLFHFEKGNQNNMTALKNGKIPLVSAKNGDNGLKNFVSKNNKKIFYHNCLTLNNDGDGGAGIAYYQPYDFLLDSHVTALTPKMKLNRFVLLFISRCITSQRNKFGHGYSLTNNRITAFKMMLPINSKKEPDYEYMENYIKKDRI